MITIMKANEMMPSCAIENATPVDLATTKVAAAVPGPQMTSAAVPMNSAASFLGRVTSAIDPPTTPRIEGPWTSPPSGEGGGSGRQCSEVPNNVSQSFRPHDAAVNRGPSGSEQAYATVSAVDTRTAAWPGFGYVAFRWAGGRSPAGRAFCADLPGHPLFVRRARRRPGVAPDAGGEGAATAHHQRAGDRQA